MPHYLTIIRFMCWGGKEKGERRIKLKLRVRKSKAGKGTLTPPNLPRPQTVKRNPKKGEEGIEGSTRRNVIEITAVKTCSAWPVEE